MENKCNQTFTATCACGEEINLKHSIDTEKLRTWVFEEFGEFI